MSFRVSIIVLKKITKFHLNICTKKNTRPRSKISWFLHYLRFINKFGPFKPLRMQSAPKRLMFFFFNKYVETEYSQGQTV